MTRGLTGSESRIRRRIVIVDDDDDARALLGLHFQCAGYDVKLAANGNEGIAAALAMRPSVIVLDLAMPGLDGWGTMRLLRAYATTTKIPLVAWSGIAGDDVAARTLSMGFDVVIRKPSAPDEVERAVDELLSSACPQEWDLG